MEPECYILGITKLAVKENDDEKRSIIVTASEAECPEEPDENKPGD